MKDVMRGLYQDHVHLAEIANIARQELEALEAGEEAEYSLLEDTIPGCRQARRSDSFRTRTPAGKKSTVPRGDTGRGGGDHHAAR
jgi:hypothetical protein